MASQVQYRRGTNAQNAAFTGALAEITVDTTNGTLRVHDAITVGGSNIATVAYVTAQISALSSNSISSGTSNVRVFANGNVTTSAAGTANVLVVQSTGVLVTGNITGGNLLISGAIEDSAQLDIRTTASNANIVFTPNGSGNVNTAANIMPTANATANIGSSTLSFNTVFAKATSAQYADLAEKYTADADYAPGTVLEFGGDQEVTATTTSHSPRVAGIVSTLPSYIMNDGLVGDHTAMVSLTGRVPCLVQGPVAKGDRLVASDVVGHAQRLDPAQYEPGCIIGKALEDYPSGTTGTIEVAVGRF
jgi:hypothetical protein